MKKTFFAVIFLIVATASQLFASVFVGAGWGPGNITVVHAFAGYEDENKPVRARIDIGFGKSTVEILPGASFRFADVFVNDIQRVRCFAGGTAGYIVSRNGFGTVVLRAVSEVNYSCLLFGSRRVSISFAISPYVGAKIYTGGWKGVAFDYGFMLSVSFEFSFSALSVSQPCDYCMEIPEKLEI